MNAVIGLTEIVLNGDLDDAQRRDYLGTILDSAESLLSVINDMPGTDGFELAKIIRQDDRFSTVEILLLTSAARPCDLQRCEELRVAARLMKPVKQSELFDVIVRSLGLTRPEDDGWLNLVPRHIPRSQPLRILLATDARADSQRL